ncbi:MAG: family 20 glycosylhydrolase, partial [Phycisphaerae bacterium]|nr:family 20 glycosylhydrolase [Phycisphaerae bacterium]
MIKSAVMDDLLFLPMPRSTQRTGGECLGNAERAEVRIDRSVAPPQGYRLTIGRHGILIVAADEAGAFYGRQTLQQLSMHLSALPCCIIDDWPDFAARGVMLDVSRDKVPTMATLFALIDRLASWKINQLQLYIEHTFAYRDHQEVWKDASPFTADEIRALDDYCRKRFIELVPNQNSFGHMERWLKHARYLPLAEAPDGAQTPWGFYWNGPFSLCPTDPKSIPFLAGLYDELLPNFRSGLFNVGCDETFDIGAGRSAAAVKERGVHAVYLDFLESVYKLVQERGRRMMFWGDIIRHAPELLPALKERLPNAIAMVWNYEAETTFDADGAMFASVGVPFYVCPGTSSWCSIAGRTDVMRANARSAAIEGKRHGAIGYLMTDWGDYGHL